MADVPEKLPARYIGGHPVVLGAFGGPYYDAQGRPLATLSLAYGDTLMVYAHEVRGETYLMTPQGSEFVGVGHVAKAEHQGLSRSELESIGYSFHEPRSDFEEILPESASVPASPLPEARVESAQAPTPETAQPLVESEVA